MRPSNLKTKIFLDSGDPNDTRKIINQLGFLDGQTTNPSLVTKNPKFIEIQKKGGVCKAEELLNEYRKLVVEISELIPGKSVSIEVSADLDTKAEEMVEQGLEMNKWIDNAHIKLPSTKEGIKAAIKLREENVRVNMTLIFSQEQTAAIHKAINSELTGDVFCFSIYRETR
ncbi:MAG: transaldolase family protein [Candidatus Dojkabacteria bacterium]|nr:transaldolase family protein [Candidatus Dojkabacteria bacterium]